MVRIVCVKEIIQALSFSFLSCQWPLIPLPLPKHEATEKNGWPKNGPETNAPALDASMTCIVGFTL